MGDRAKNWVAALAAGLLVPAYLETGWVPKFVPDTFWVGAVIFTVVFGLAIWASVVAARRLSRWWYAITVVWVLLYLLYVFAVFAFAAM